MSTLNTSRALGKAHSRGYLTVRLGNHDELTSLWSAECQATGRPLVIVSLIGHGLAFVVAQGIDDVRAQEALQQLVAVEEKVDEQAALFPVDRHRDGTYTIGPLQLARAHAGAQQLVSLNRHEKPTAA